MMADLFWPGDERAATAFAQADFLATMVEVELVWFRALQAAGVVPKAADAALGELVTNADLAEIATKAEASGNPVVPLVALMRARLAARDEVSARWLHRGLTSQDVLDTALVLAGNAKPKKPYATKKTQQ